MDTSFRMETGKDIVNCKSHGDYERSFVKFGNKEPVTTTGGGCPQCAIEHLEQVAIKQKEDRKEETERQRGYRVENFERLIPPRFKNACLENYVTETSRQKEALETCKRYCKGFNTDIKSSGGGLILIGKVGTGKTHLAIGMGRAIASLNNSVGYIGLTELIREIRSCWTDDTKNESELVKHYQNLGLLIVDEIGVQNGSENERNILFEIIDGRYQRINPTIILSNLSLKDVSDFISQRSVDRITQGGGVIPFDWESHRSQL